MTDIRKWAFVGLMGLGFVSVGCASNNGSSGTGGSNGSGGTSAKGGSNGSGGTSAKGGSNGSGGTSSSGSGGTSSSGSGGTSSSGSGGAGGATLGCAMSDAPTGALIADFSGADGGVGIEIGHGDNDPFTYGSTPKPTFTLGSGSVNVTDTVQIAGGPYYQGFGIYFNGNSAGTDCINASSYTGVQFDLSGSLTGTGCAMVFSINDSEHADSSVLNSAGTAPNDPKASGPKGSYAPQEAISASQITTPVQTIKVPFTGPAFANGAASPATAVDPTKVTGVQWQLATPTPSTGDGGATECVWNITLANVKFY
jgi:hypothetical protein